MLVSPKEQKQLGCTGAYKFLLLLCFCNVCHAQNSRLEQSLPLLVLFGIVRVMSNRAIVGTELCAKCRNLGCSISSSRDARWDVLWDVSSPSGPTTSEF